jgi:lipid-binding SYLF domain-containing protein
MRLARRLLLPLLSLLAAACGAPSMHERLDQARHALAEINTLTVHPSVEEMKKAVGVALLSLGQGGVVIGGEGGGGIVLQRVTGGWGSPYAVDLGAGTIGLQLGGQGKDVMVLFNDAAALKEFVKGGMQLQAVGEGTIGAASGNTKEPKLNTTVFVKGQGVFGGLELGGLNVGPATSVNAGAYGKADAEAILTGKVQPANVKEPLERLLKMLDAMH